MKALKHLLVFLLLILFLIPILPAQTVALFQYRHVPQDNIDEFIHRETTYWSEVAQDAIDNEKLEYWALYEKVGGWDLEGGSNFLFINVFNSPEALNDMGSVWNPAKVFPMVRPQDMETNSLGIVKHQLTFEVMAGEGEGDVTFIRINYAKASDLSKYLELEQSTWAPFIKGQIESGNAKQLTWRLGRLVSPAGNGLPFNAITVDGYTKLSEAIFPSTSWKTTPEFPSFDELNAVHEKDRIQVYRLVKKAE